MTARSTYSFPLKPMVSGVRCALLILCGVIAAVDASAQVSVDTAKQDPQPAKTATGVTTAPTQTTVVENGRVISFPNKDNVNMPYCSDVDMAELKRQPDGTIMGRSDTLRGVMNDVATLNGRSCIVRKDKNDDIKMQGDRIDYVYVADEVTSKGNAKLRNKNGDVVTGETITFNLTSQTGRAKPAQYDIVSTGGRGTAESLDVLSSRRALMQDAYYTTCVGDNPDWYLKSQTMLIDQDRDVGEGLHSVLVFKKIPILATPYIQFPLGNRRRSGFLTPSFGVSSKSGVDITVPYYFNLAPNYDLTIYPGLLSKRGAKLAAEYRYMTKHVGSGTLFGSYVLSDKKYGNQDRYYWRIQHSKSGQLWKGIWTVSVDAQRASDKNFFDDISTKNIDASERVLPSEYAVQYRVGNWLARARYKRNQVLQNSTNTVDVPYDFKPQFTLTGSQRLGNFVFGLDAESTHFKHLEEKTDPPKDSSEKIKAYYAQDKYARGWRHAIYPSVKYDLRRAGWFITPKIGLYVTKYDLDYIPGLDSSGNKIDLYDKKVTRTLPIMSLDAGLIYERSGLSWFGEPSLQTLEPRIYYLRIPYRDQSRIWNFDSALADFDTSHIFSENIFTGRDRIAEANQVTTGVTSRILSQKTGEELFTVTAAHRYYFNDQRVTLPNTTASSRQQSDLLLASSGKIAKNIWIDASARYSFDQSSLKKLDASVRWQPELHKSVGVGYSRNATVSPTASSAFVSVQWPVSFISPNLYGMARINYNLQSRKLSDAVIGWEYVKDCWIWSAVAKRTIDGNGKYNNSYYMQVEFKGLAGLGNDPNKVLKDNIVGYQPLRFSDIPPEQPVTPVKKVTKKKVVTN